MIELMCYNTHKWVLFCAGPLGLAASGSLSSNFSSIINLLNLVNWEVIFMILVFLLQISFHLALKTRGPAQDRT